MEHIVTLPRHPAFELRPGDHRSPGVAAIPAFNPLDGARL